MNQIDNNLAPQTPQEPSVLERVSMVASRRHFLIGATLAGVTALVETRVPRGSSPRVAKTDFDHWVPDKVGTWKFVTSSGVVQPPADALSDRLYDDLVTRVYNADDKPVVMIALAYNNIQTGVLQVHRPEICYPAGGYSLTSTEQISVLLNERSITANFFTASGYNRTEQVLYWTRVGKDFPYSWSTQRLAVVRANLRGWIPDGMLARFSILSEDRKAALELLTEFVREFEAAAAPQLRRLLVG